MSFIFYDTKWKDSWKEHTSIFGGKARWELQKNLLVSQQEDIFLICVYLFKISLYLLTWIREDSVKMNYFTSTLT